MPFKILLFIINYLHKFRFIDLFNHIIWLQYMQEQSRQTLLPGLKLSYEHPPLSGARFLSLGRANSVQADLLAGEQGLDTGFEGGELRRIEAFGAADDGGCGLLGRLERL